MEEVVVHAEPGPQKKLRLRGLNGKYSRILPDMPTPERNMRQHVVFVLLCTSCWRNLLCICHGDIAINISTTISRSSKRKVLEDDLAQALG